VVHLVDPDADHLLHAPFVGERLGPERIDAVLWRAVLVDDLFRDHLGVASVAGAERRKRTHHYESGT
jgi:hypothetical protein